MSTEALPTPPKRDPLTLPRYTFREVMHYLHWFNLAEHPGFPAAFSLSLAVEPVTFTKANTWCVDFTALVRLFELGHSAVGTYYFWQDPGLAEGDVDREDFRTKGPTVSAKSFVGVRDLVADSSSLAWADTFRDRMWRGTSSTKARKALRDRVVYEGDQPVRFYPLTRKSSPLDSPRLIAIDPRYGFGRPIFAERNLRIDAITSRFWAGEGAAEIAEDTGIPAAHIEEAIRFESSYRHK